MGHEHIDIELHQLGCKLVEAVVITLGPPIVDDNVLALLVSELAKARSQGVNLASVLSVRENAKKADPVNFPGWLRCRRERPNQQGRRRRAAEQRDEIAPSHVGHGLLLALWRRPMRSVYHTPSLPRTGRQAMGQT